MLAAGLKQVIGVPASSVGRIDLIGLGEGTSHREMVAIAYRRCPMSRLSPLRLRKTTRRASGHWKKVALISGPSMVLRKPFEKRVEDARRARDAEVAEPLPGLTSWRRRTAACRLQRKRRICSVHSPCWCGSVAVRRSADSPFLEPHRQPHLLCNVTRLEPAGGSREGSRRLCGHRVSPPSTRRLIWKFKSGASVACAMETLISLRTVAANSPSTGPRRSH